MSNWTHVAATVRIDHFRFTGEPDFHEVFGKECLWDSPDETWADCRANPGDYMPMGSEGSLEMSVWDNPDKDQFASFTVSIFGDLRDHRSVEEIADWFEGKCSEVRFRQAVLMAQNEFSGKTLVTCASWGGEFRRTTTRALES